MKKLILAALITLISFVANAQKFQGGVEVGWNLSHPFHSDGVSHGFKIGVFGQYNFTMKWFVDAALRLSYKPWRKIDSMQEGDISDDMSYWKNSYYGNPYVLELPVHAGFQFGLSRDLKMNVALGPCFGIGLFGKMHEKDLEVDDLNQRFEYKYSYNLYGDDMYSIKRFEIGADIRLGLEIKKHYLVSVGYLLQLNINSSASPVGKSQVTSLNIGYKF